MIPCLLWFLAGIARTVLASVGVVWLFLRAAESGEGELVDRG